MILSGIEKDRLEKPLEGSGTLSIIGPNPDRPQEKCPREVKPMAKKTIKPCECVGSSGRDAEWLCQPEALEWLYKRYHRRLVGFARRQIVQKGIDPAAADGSDVVQDGWKSFLSWILAASHRKPLPTDQDELWRILCTFVMRKVLLRLRLQWRGGQAVVPASALRMNTPEDADEPGDFFAQIEGSDIDPAEAVIVAETIDALRRAVADDPWTKRAVELSLAGKTTAEIVAALTAEFGMSQATAYRQIDKLRIMCRQLTSDEA
jgi:DNA-directed RNA polymerase specialized sigma24 family protein